MSDRDCYALLSRDGFGGRNAFSLVDYGRLSDKQILALLTIAFDEEGKLVPEERPETLAGSPLSSGTPARATRELPSQKELGIREGMMEELLSVKPRVGAQYIQMFFQVWKHRGAAPEDIAAKYHAHVRTDK